MDLNHFLYLRLLLIFIFKKWEIAFEFIERNVIIKRTLSNLINVLMARVK